MKETLYLAGPIHGAEDPISWRIKADQKLSHRWIIIDPINDPAFPTVYELVKFDLSRVWHADGILAKVDVPSWGTAMEIFSAYQARVPVYAFGAPEQRSPWLQYHVKHFYETLDDAIEALK